VASEATTRAEARTLVTGANGFIGRALCQKLQAAGYFIRAAVRARPEESEKCRVELAPSVRVAEVNGSTDWHTALDEIDFVVHLAAQVHVMRPAGGNMAGYRRVNVEGTAKLAHDAAAHGIKRFVFLSSVKVHGERISDRPFTEGDIAHPEDAYGISKWEAEQALAQIAKETGMEVVVLRAPLVYGPGVKANFLRLMRLVARGVPLPFASVTNLRSVLYVGNLVDAIITSLEAPAAAGKTYLVSDDEDVSTPDLIRALAGALEVPVRLFPCPVAVLRAGADVVGRGDEMARLVGSLQVDSSRIRSELGWRPRYSLAEGLRETARWFRDADTTHPHHRPASGQGNG